MTTTSDKAIVRKGMDLIDEMDRDELNELVDYIREVIKANAGKDRARAYAEFSVGDRVRINPKAKMKPQYLAGLTGEITEKRQSRVTVKLDRGPIGKFRTGRVITQPSVLLHWEG
jgi:ribosomal protein L21E